MSNEIQKLPVPASEQRVLENLIRDLNETYPNKIIVRLQQDHKNWSEKVTRLYKNIGYASRDEFLAAYGFTVDKPKGGRPSNDLNSVVEELISRYSGDKCVISIEQLKEENPDLSPKLKSIQNKAKDLFGMSFSKYLIEKGVLQSSEGAAASKVEEYKEKLSSVVNELKNRYESKTIPANLAELKDQNSDIVGISNINSWTENAYGKKALDYFTEIGLLKEKPKKIEKKKSGDFDNSDDIEAFCSKKFALSEFRAYVNKLGLSEDIFKGVKYKKI